MVFFDIVSLFTKITFDLAMEIARKQLESYPNKDLPEITNWSEEEIFSRLRICFRNLITSIF